MRGATLRITTLGRCLRRRATVGVATLAVAASLLSAGCASVSESVIRERASAYRAPALDLEMRFFEHGPATIAYYDTGVPVGAQGGDAAGATLIFLHGALVNKDSWQYQIREFANEYRVVVPDLRGHGDSTGPKVDGGGAPNRGELDGDWAAPEEAGLEAAASGGAYTAEVYAADLRALMDHLGVERAVLIGHSMGGFIVQKLAAQHPNRVRAGVLVDTSYGIRTSVWERMMSAFADVYMANTSMPSLIEAFAEDAGKHDSHTRAYMYQAMQRYLDNRDEFEAVWNVVDTFDMRDRLADIVVPVLIVSPADSSQAAGQARRMNREIPHSERVVVADAGHMVMMDNPDGFNSELRAFLRRLGEEAP